MIMSQRKSKMVSFRVSPQEYRRFLEVCTLQGLRSVSELARTALDQLVDNTIATAPTPAPATPRNGSSAAPPSPQPPPQPSVEAPSDDVSADVQLLHHRFLQVNAEMHRLLQLIREQQERTTKSAKAAGSSLFLALLLTLTLTTAGAQTATTPPPSTYTLGPDDQILIRVLDAEEVAGNTPIRIDQRGIINLPLAGRVKASGLTTEQLEEELRARLKKFLQEPDVTVTLTELRSQPISILGSVQSPGVHQLQGRRSLFEVLSLAGGLRQDAGHTIKITRRKEWGNIPLPNAQPDSTGEFSVAAVAVKSVLEAANPAENIQIRPHDVISIPKADIVYVIGAVKKSGGFVLGENEKLGALEILALAEGLDRMAAGKKAKIMRKSSDTTAEREEIPLDLEAILKGKAKDVSLEAEDILFVPINTGKVVATRTLETALGMGSSITTGLIIWRR